VVISSRLYWRSDLKKGFFTSLLALTVSGQLWAATFSNGSAYVFADLLDWQVREGSNVQWSELISPIGTANPTVQLLDVSLAWNTGYRIGGGYRSQNNWDSVIYFTSYHTDGSDQVLAPGQLYSPYIGNFFQNNTNGSANGPFYNAAGIKWKFAFNTVDLELGRTFKIERYLNLRPYVGIKSAIINQNIYTTWQGPNTLFLGFPIPITTFASATENLSNDFSGIGPSFGLDSTWPIYKLSNGSVNLIGNFSTALLWGLWRYKDVFRTNTASTVTVTGNDVNGAAPMVRGFIGVEWLGTFSKADVNVRLGYEGQVWFDQVQFNMLSSGRLNDIMSMQGGVLDFGVHF